MRLRARADLDLALLSLVVLVLVLVIVLWPSTALRIVLGIPALLFCPGYALISALYPRRIGIDGIEKLVFSIGISVAIVPLIGLILNYTPPGITLTTVLSSTASFTLIMSVVAWIRRRRLPTTERFGIGFRFRIPIWGGSALDKALTVLVALSLIGAVAVAGYTMAKPKVDEHFTEFYILGAQGMAAYYPSEVMVGDTVGVLVGISNQEHETVSYRLVSMLDGVEIGTRGPIVLEHEGRWEQSVSFTTTRVGDDQKLELLLYRDADVEPYLEPLRLWIDVTE